VAARIGVAGPSLQPYFSKPEAVSRSVAEKREVVKNITILIPRWKKAFASAELVQRSRQCCQLRVLPAQPSQ
jgi:hypothetical protein